FRIFRSQFYRAGRIAKLRVCRCRQVPGQRSPCLVCNGMIGAELGCCNGQRLLQEFLGFSISPRMMVAVTQAVQTCKSVGMVRTKLGLPNLERFFVEPKRLGMASDPCISVSQIGGGQERAGVI